MKSIYTIYEAYNQVVEATGEKFGDRMKLVNIYGVDDILLNLKGSALRGALDGAEPDKETLSAVDAYNDRYNALHPVSNARKTLMANFITFLKELTLSAPIEKIVNDKKAKDTLLKDVTNHLHLAGVIPTQAYLHNRKSDDYGGDRRDTFQITLNYKYDELTFVFEYKK